LFFRICNNLAAHNPYFCKRTDALGLPGFDGMHKCVVAMRMLANRTIADSLDDGYSMAESTVLECVKEFARLVQEVFQEEFLQPPNASEMNRVLQENEVRGFPVMLDSIDYMHWDW
jgi:hypothetical protein